MEWRADALVLGVRRLGETSAVLDVWTRDQGRHAGLVRGGAGRRMAPVLQPGNQVDASWRARLDDHLGSFTIEPRRARTGLLSDRLALAGLGAVTGMALFALPDRQPYPQLYEDTEVLLDMMEAGLGWPPFYVKWEVDLLGALGFGLDLESCAVTGAQTDLTHVSPRSGRAVARGAGGEWADRLLRLPPFLRRDAGDRPITLGDVTDGLALTGYFLRHRMGAAMHQGDLPPARGRLERAIRRG